MVSAIRSASSSCCAVFLAPFRCISNKVRAVAEAIFGYLLRIVTFQLGEMRVRGAYTITRIYQRLSYDPRDEKPFNLKRLEDSKQTLVQFGGREATVRPADGKAEIKCMTFKSADFFAEFENLGCKTIQVMYEGELRKAFVNPPPIADKFYFSKVEINRLDGTKAKGILLPEEPPQGADRPMIFHSHSPGRSMCMDRKFIGLHLAAGYDVAIWDPRGTVESTGSPSEGGYYLDAEAVLQHLLDQGYRYDRIYLSGFCEGAAICSFLKKKYHHLGIHFIASNPYTSMREVLLGHGWLGRMGERYGITSLQDSTLNVGQDAFDNLKKLRSLRHTKSQGQFIFLHTDTDKMMPHGTVQRLCDAVRDAGPVREILRVHPDPKANGHMQPPYEDPVVWRRYVQVVI